MMMTTCQIKSVWDVFRKIMGLFGGSLAGVFALGIFTHRANGAEALIGGIAAAVVLFFMQATPGSTSFFTPGSASLPVSWSATWRACSYLATGNL